MFPYWTRNTIFRQILSKKEKLSHYDETWCLNKFRYAELNGNIYLFCFENGNIVFWVKFDQNTKIAYFLK